MINNVEVYFFYIGDLNVVGIVTDVVSLTYSVRKPDPQDEYGDFELTLRQDVWGLEDELYFNNPPFLPKVGVNFQNKILVQFWDEDIGDTKVVYMVENIERNVTEDGVPVVVLSGRDVSAVIENRVIDPSYRPYDYVVNMQVWEVAYRLIDVFITDASLSARKISKIVPVLFSGYPTDVSGDVTYHQVTLKTVFEQLAADYNLYMYATKRIEDQVINYGSSKISTRDRSLGNTNNLDPVIFSTENDNLVLSSMLYRNQNTTNYLYVFFSDGVRKTVTSPITASVNIRGLLRREGVEVLGEPYDGTRWVYELLPQYRAKLANTDSKILLEGTVVDPVNIKPRFNKEFFAGDMVTLMDPHVGYENKYVSEVIVSYNEQEGRTVSVGFEAVLV